MAKSQIVAGTQASIGSSSMNLSFSPVVTYSNLDDETIIRVQVQLTDGPQVTLTSSPPGDIEWSVGTTMLGLPTTHGSATTSKPLSSGQVTTPALNVSCTTAPSSSSI